MAITQEDVKIALLTGVTFAIATLIIRAWSKNPEGVGWQPK